MRTMPRKSIFTLFILILSVTLVACSGNNGSNNKVNNNGNTNANNSSSTEAEKAPSGFELGKYDPPITITTVRQVGPEVKFKEGESLDDNVFTRWLRDNMGIIQQTLWTTPTTNDAYKTKLMLTLTTNEELPDFLTVPAAIAPDLIESGKFRSVDDLFEEYASDKWKAAMDEIDNVWLPYKRDGKAYAIPMIESKLTSEDAMWIRQDWLDHLGLDAPTTIEELEVVMDAFVNKDPDQNGKKDTFAVTAAGKSIQYNLTSWIGLNGLLGAYDAYQSIWHKNEQGEIVYGSTTPEMKTALGKVKGWLDKGYLHKEIGIHDEVKAMELFTSSQAGIAFANQWAYDWPLNAVESNIEGAKVMPYPLPAGPYGKAGQVGNGLNHWLVTLINKDMEHPEALFMYQNYMYEHLESPVKGSEFEHGFAQGYDYDIVDGKVVTTEQEMPGGKFDPQYLLMKPTTPSLRIKTLAELADGKQPTTPYEQALTSISPETKLSAKIVYDQRDSIVANLYSGPLTPTMKDNLDNHNQMEADMFNKIIYGNEPLDYFDVWVDNWRKSGGDKITEEITEWYKAAGGK